jgi:hypothetical protein
MYGDRQMLRMNRRQEKILLHLIPNANRVIDFSPRFKGGIQ